MADAAPEWFVRGSVPGEPWRAAITAAAGAALPTVLLADGMTLSPFAAGFIGAALAHADPQMAGAGLAIPRRRPENDIPIIAMEDGSDVIHARPDDPPAMIVTPAQAAAMTAWFAAAPPDAGVADYLTATDRFLLLPRLSLIAPVAGRAAPVLAERAWRLSRAGTALAVYDQWWEPDPRALVRLSPWLAAYDFDVDIWGAKPAAALVAPYAISGRSCAQAVQAWPLALVPIEAGLILAPLGNWVSLAKTADFAPMTAERRRKMTRHVTRYADIGGYAGQLLGAARRGTR